MRGSLLLVLAILIAACTAMPQAARASDARKDSSSREVVSHPTGKKKPRAAPKTAEACAAAGGTWRKVGMLREELCDVPTLDAGKPCKSSTECESACVAREGADLTKPVTGACYKSLVLVGTCLTRVENGKVDSAQCAD